MEGTSGATWFMEDDREFTFDHVCADGVKEAGIIDVLDVVFSDHAAVSVSIEWKGKKQNLDGSLYNEFGVLMEHSVVWA